MRERIIPSRRFGSDLDLTPRPACVAQSGGVARYPSITAGAYLLQRLKESGIG